MPKLTNEQIEQALEGALDDVRQVMGVTSSARIVEPAIKGSLRASFLGGVDHGKALILERAGEMLVNQVADERTVQLGRSLDIIMQWVSVLAGRMFCGCAATYGSVFLSESEGTINGFSTVYQHGSDANETISKLASWCSEHMQPVDRDTLPAPESAPTEPKLEVAADLSETVEF